MMKRAFIKMSKRSAALLMAIVMMISLLFSGCDVEVFLQDLATDYIQVSILNDSGTLLSESENNVQKYIYRIDAEITNAYVLELTNAIVTLNVPDNVEFSEHGDKKTVKERSIGVDETKSYSWVIKIPMTEADQNIEYSVSIVSDVSSQVQAYGLVWVDGTNRNDNRLDFDTDTWKFNNYGEIPIPLTQEDYDAFLIGMSNSNKDYFKDIIAESAGGYCYGMAVTSILTKMGRLSVSNIDASAENLHAIKRTDKAKSVIGYYWLTQFFGSVLDERADFERKTTAEKLEIIEKKAKAVESGGNPFVFSFYTKPNSEGGHAVVGYSHESGVFKWGGKEYDSRILIYDSNSPKWNEKSCLYYNDGTSEWYIPKYPDSSDITRALSDLNIMDMKNIETGAKSVNSYITARGNENLSIYEADGALVGTVDGVNTSGDKLTAFRTDGDDSSLTIAISGNKSKETPYTIEPSDSGTELDLSIKYNNFFLSASGDKQNSITFSPEGNVEIKGETSGFNISITADEGHYSTDWYQISISGDSGTDPKVEMVSDGYILSGENLKDITVYAENENTANKLNIRQADAREIHISQEGENLCAKSDKDRDGKYETMLATGKSTSPDDPTEGGTNLNFGSLINFDFNFGFGGDISGSGGVWAIVAIVGVLLIAAIVVAVAVAGRSKKKKDDELEIPIIDDSEVSLEESEQPDKIDQSELGENILNGIEILNGNMAGHKFELVDGKSYIIGKDPKLAHILLDLSYGSVSRVHCNISYSEQFGKYYVIDCSSNGTYLQNNTRLAKNIRTPLERGAILKLANDNCQVKLL